jgi:hypothetical protein
MSVKRGHLVTEYLENLSDKAIILDEVCFEH